MENINLEEKLQVLADNYASSLAGLSANDLKPILMNLLRLTADTAQLIEDFTILEWLVENDLMREDSYNLILTKTKLKNDLFSS